MIFITVGTHEQQFNRLIKYVDDMVDSGIITEEVIIQSGFSTYKANKCCCIKFLSYSDMIETIMKARIVITHGGPASFIQVLQNGKVPIVVPRMLEYKEHVNNHQVDFVRAVKQRYNNIIPIYDINELEETICRYDSIIKELNFDVVNNNQVFNNKLEKIVKEII